MSISYSVTPSNSKIAGGTLGQAIPVIFTISRSGDTSTASSVNWSVLGDPEVPAYIEDNFFIPNTPISGVLNFSAGQTTQTLTLSLKGGINVLPSDSDWGTFNIGVRLGATGASSSGFSQSASGGYGVTTNDYIVNGTGGVLTLDYEMYTIPDQADVYLNNHLILTTGAPVSGNATLTYPSGAPTPLQVGDDVKVVITGNIQGTAWDYSINYQPGISAVVEGSSTFQTGVPGTLELARLADDVYGPTGASIHGYHLLKVSDVDPSFAGFSAAAYSNEDGSQIVIAYRGTFLPQSVTSLTTYDIRASLKNLLTDTSFVTNVASSTFTREVTDAVTFTNQIEQTYGSGAKYTLTGHSLGGALAQLVGNKGAFSTTTFNAPGSGLLISQEYSTLSGLSVSGGGASLINYRMNGDQVSLAGQAMGLQQTVSSTLDSSDVTHTVLSALGNHKMNLMLQQLKAYYSTPAAATIKDGVPANTINVVPTLQKVTAQDQYFSPKGLKILLITLGVDALVNTVLDPSDGTNFIFREKAGSPLISSFALPAFLGVASYSVQTFTNGAWSAPTTVTPEVNINVPANTTAFKFIPLDGFGNVTAVPGDFYINATFASKGQVSANVIGESGDQSARRDFFGSGASDLVWRFADGRMNVWVANNGALNGRDFGIIGNDWQMQNTAADYNGDGNSDILWRNADGRVNVWSSTGSDFTGRDFGQVGLDWNVNGAGDFNGDGYSDILWRNVDGTVDVWNWTGNDFAGRNFGKVDVSWWVADTGDFNGDGSADILWRNVNGEVAVWSSSQTDFIGHDFGHVGGDWAIAATGDFNGDGKTDIAWRNVNGDLDIWSSTGNSFNGTDYGIVGNDWHIKQTGDMYGDGASDLVWRNDNGDLNIWSGGKNGFQSKDYGIVNPGWRLNA